MNKEMIKPLFEFVGSGIPLSFVRRLSKNKITVLVYHNPGPELFRDHLKILLSCYTFVGLDEIYDSLWGSRQHSLPTNSACVTFDDGHKGNYKLLELFQMYNIRPTIFLCSGYVGTNKKYWDSYCSRDQLKRIKEMKNSERIELLTKLGYHEEVSSDPDNRQALNHHEIEEMTPYVDFQSHTVSHPVLTHCSDEEIEYELRVSKAQIEELTGKPCKYLAYPHGIYDERVIHLAQLYGYKIGRTIDVGLASRESNPFCLRMIGVSDDATTNKLRIQLTGVYQYLLYATRLSFDGRFRL